MKALSLFKIGVLTLAIVFGSPNFVYASHDLQKNMRASWIKEATKSNESGIRDFTFSPDGHSLYVINSIDTLLQIDAETGKTIKNLVIPHQNGGESYLSKISITPDGKKLYLTSLRKYIYVVHTADLSLQSIIKTKPATFTYEMVMTPTAVFVADLRTYQLGEQSNINVIDTYTDKVIEKFLTKRSPLGFSSIAMTPDARYVYVSDYLLGDSNGPYGEDLPPGISLYDRQTHAIYADFIPQIRDARKMILDVQHKKMYLTSGDLYRDKIFYIVDINTNTLLKKLPLLNMASALGISSDQGKVYLAQENAVLVFNTTNDNFEDTKIDFDHATAIHTGLDSDKIYFSNAKVIAIVDVKRNAIIKTVKIND